MSDRKKTLFEAGAIMLAKDGKRLYIKVNKDFSVKAGEFISLEKPQEALKRLAEKGFLTEEELEARLEKVPDFVKYNLNI